MGEYNDYCGYNEDTYGNYYDNSNNEYINEDSSANESYFDEECNDVYEVAQYNSNYRIIDRIDNILEWITSVIKYIVTKILYEVEIYQIIGFVGAVLLSVGSFCPMITIEYFEVADKINYMEADGIIIFLFSILIILLIIINKHKYTLAPAILSVAINLSVQFNLLVLSDYVHYNVGFYVVWLGGIVVIGSVFLINCGYARDSAFRKNKPLYFKDIIWISLTLVLAFVVTYITSRDGVILEYIEKIDKLNEVF